MVTLNINNNTTIVDIKNTRGQDIAIIVDKYCSIKDPRVAVWAFEHIRSFNIYYLDSKLLNDPRVALAICMYDSENAYQIDRQFQRMSFNELYKATMNAHLNDPEEDWSFDIKHKFFIDRDNCAIHMYDLSNEIWRQLDDCEIDALEGVGLHYFIGYTRSGEAYNLRTGEIIE